MVQLRQEFQDIYRQRKSEAADLYRGLRGQLANALPPEIAEFLKVFSGVRSHRAAAQAAADQAGMPGVGSAVGAPLPVAAGMILAMEFLTGVVQELGPALKAFLAPAAMVGEVLGRALLPVLEALFPVVKFLAIIFTYAAQVIGNVVGALAKVIGEVVAAIGDLISRIPGLGQEGRAIEKFGRGLAGFSSEMLKMADSMPGLRDKLMALTWKEAMDRAAGAADKLAHSMINVVEGFRESAYYDRAVAGAAAPVVAGGGGAGGGQAGGGVVFSGPVSWSLSFQAAPGNDGRAQYRALYDELSSLALANPEFRPVFATFPNPR
jgi:hypothetical protein